MNAFKSSIRSFLEAKGINLAKNSLTLGLTPQREIVNLLLRIRPVSNGYELIRIGGPGDGGYLVPNDFEGIQECFSPGSNLLWSFEKSLQAQFGIRSFMCDTIDQKPQNLTQYQEFTPAWVGPHTDGKEFISLGDWIKTASKSQGDLVLQMDIEGAEFQTLLSLSTSDLLRFRIIVIEIHFLEALKNRWAFEMIYRPFFERLIDNFDVVHLHPNNCCGIWSIGQFEYPRIIELTLHRKNRSKSVYPLESSRNVLDSPCVDSNPEISIIFSDSTSDLKIKMEKVDND